MSVSGELPVGTVTFLFTDIEGSTQLLRQLGGERYGEALGDHQRILREAFAEHGGHEIDTQGDSFFVAFRRAKDAVSAAIACQRRLAEHAWPEGTDLSVRMGIHTGEPAVGGERYVGMGVHRAARICAAGHGGQVLVSQTTRELLRDDPIEGVSLRDLGEHQLKDMDEPERIYQLAAPGMRAAFPELKTAAPTPFEGREGELAEAAAEEMAKRWRRPGRRVLIGATLAAALVGVALGVLLTQGGGSTAGASVGPNALGVVDSKSGKVVSQIPVGVAPGGVAAGADAIWVTNTGGNSVSRVDPGTNDVRQTIPVGGGPTGIAASSSAVWVANGLDGTVSRIDPQSNQPTQTIPVGNGPTGVGYGLGAVWVTNSTDGTITKINPLSGRTTGPIPAIVGASSIAVGFGRLWVVSPPAGVVIALDPRSGEVLKRIAVGVDPSAVATDAGAVWVANRADGTVSKIDPRALAVTALVRVGRHPTDIAAALDAVWVANEGDGTLSRIDPSSGALEKTVPLANPAEGVAISPRGVYVAVGSTGLEHRGGELRVLSDAVSSIDPATPDNSTSQIVLMTNDGLVGFRKAAGVEGTQLVPDLAAALPTPTNGGKTYTFQLRPGIRYSNGRLVQPDDFRRALERSIRIAGITGAGYGRIVGADRCVQGKSCDLSRGIVTDRAARTVTFRLTGPDADFLADLAQPGAFAVPAGTPPHDVGAHPVPATGPYRIAVFDRKARTVRVVRNPRFREWSADAQPQGYPDSISVVWRNAGDSVARVRQVEHGAADVALGGFPPLARDAVDRLAIRFPSQLHVNPLLAMSEFFLNTRLAPFDDIRVRRALNDAFDREAFTRQLGPAFAPTCRILPRNFPGYRPTCPYRSGGSAGIEAARRLVRSSGTAGTPVTVWVFGSVAEQGRYMVSLLNLLGYRAHLKVVGDVGAYFAAVADSRVPVQIGYVTWFTSFPSAAAWLPPSWSCASFVPAAPENQNLSRFCDRSIDAQMTRAAAVQVQDPAAATVLWQQAEQSLLAQAPDVPMYTPSVVDFVSKRAGNYQYSPSWGVLLDQLWVK